MHHIHNALTRMRKEELHFVISRNNSEFDRLRAGRILLIYELKHSFIGDDCRFFSKLRMASEYFMGRKFDVNVVRGHECCETLLRFNPFIGRLMNTAWESIDYSFYDVVVLVSDYESEMEQVLLSKVGEYERSVILKTSFFGANDELDISPPFLSLQEYYEDY